MSIPHVDFRGLGPYQWRIQGCGGGGGGGLGCVSPRPLCEVFLLQKKRRGGGGDRVYPATFAHIFSSSSVFLF